MVWTNLGRGRRSGDGDCMVYYSLIVGDGSPVPEPIDYEFAETDAYM